MVANAVSIEQSAHRGDELLDEGHALSLALLELVYDVVICLRLDILQRQILQGTLDAIQTELMGNLSIEVKALPALGKAFLLGEDVERAHNLKAVSKLDEYDARILGVGDNHISKVRSLLLGALQLNIRYLAKCQGYT